MPNSTTWENDYDERTLECTAAKIAVALQSTPREWPISGAATTFNPDGFLLSDPMETGDATPTSSDRR